MATRRTLTDAEMSWAEALHTRWVEQCEAEGFPVPPDPVTSVVQAAYVGMSRLYEAERWAIEQAQRELAEMAKVGIKAS